MFDGVDSNGVTGLWVSDGTATGTVELTKQNASDIFVSGGKAYFSGFDNYSAYDLPRLWLTNGTVSGTVEIGGAGNAGITNADTDGGMDPQSFAALGGKTFFVAFDSASYEGLWVTDGTASGTVEISGYRDSAVHGWSPDGDVAGFNVSATVSIGNKVLFTAEDAKGDYGLWVSDGTAKGTFEIGGLSNAGVAGAFANGLDAKSFVASDGKAYFEVQTATNDEMLWVSDGTVAGTHEIDVGAAAVLTTGFTVGSATVEVSRTSSQIEALTAAQIKELVSGGVSTLKSTTGAVALSEKLAIELEAAKIMISVPKGSVTSVADSGANLAKLTSAQIKSLEGIGVSEVNIESGVVTFTAAQTSALLSTKLGLSETKNSTITELFANGAYRTYASNELTTSKVVYVDGSYEIAHYHLPGPTYTSTVDVYAKSGAKLAEARNLKVGGGQLLISANSLVISTAANALNIATDHDKYVLSGFADKNEAIFATGKLSEIFELSKGFGTESITGFIAGKAQGHDEIQLRASAFGASLTAANQHADFLALLSHANQNDQGSVIITDNYHDSLTLVGITRSSLVSVPDHIESCESFVIQGRRSDSLGGRRCGRTRTVVATIAASCAIRAT